MRKIIKFDGRTWMLKVGPFVGNEGVIFGCVTFKEAVSAARIPLFDVACAFFSARSRGMDEVSL